jgi:aspartate racemase
MQIGLIGGIGPAATDFYYRRLIRVFAEKKAPLELAIVHADTSTLLDNLSRNQAVTQAQIFAPLTERLAAAGASLVAVTSIAGHFCRKEFKALSVLPVVDMIDEVAQTIADSEVRRIGILGTRTVMMSRFYGAITTATMLTPAGDGLEKVHDAYVNMAAAGAVTDTQREALHSAAHRLIEDQGAEAIMLGGTDLALVFSEQSVPYPLIDCAAIHADAIAARALA